MSRTGNFRAANFAMLGYNHIAINGQKGYHGVAIVSRHPFAGESRRDFCAKGDSRHIAVTLAGKAAGLEIHNFYVPAGGDEPDPDDQRQVRAQARLRRRDDRMVRGRT